MFIDGAARRQTLALMQGDNLSLATPDYYDPVTEELTYEEGTIKPLHYASLAKAIDMLTDEEHLPEYFLPSPESTSQETPFNHFIKDALFTFGSQLKRVAGSTDLVGPRTTINLIGKQNPNLHVEIRQQLSSGIYTATYTMATLLHNLPSIIRALRPDTKSPDLVAIAERSSVLPWQLAMMCINRMMSAQSALAGQSDYLAWSGQAVRLRPNFFSVTESADGTMSVRYKDLPNLMLPAGFSHFSPFIPPLEHDTKLRDVSCHEDVTIGCPVTLIPGRLQSMWSRFIAEYDTRALWDEPF